MRIMFPMISSLWELKQAKRLLNEVKKELKSENILFDENIPVGMMIEVPSSAIMSDLFAQHVDFFSIGTNDLIQYTVAADRMNSKVKTLYTPLNIAVLRLINQVIQNAHAEGIRVGMCGEVAGNEEYIPILLGMGLDEFSMSKGSILRARRLINRLSVEKLKPYVSKILNADNRETIHKIVSRMKIDFSL